LLSPTQAWLREKGLLEAHAEMPDGETFDRSLLFEGLVSSVQFTVDKIKLVIRGEHINLSEVRSWGLVEAHCSVHEQRSKPLIGTDSQVGLACVIKGRSASSKLNNLLSCMLPNVVGARLAPKGFWLPSRINPSDDPTRDVPIRLPITPLPAWYCALSFGEPDFSFIDIIVSQYVPSDMPDLDDLLKAAEPESARILKASGFRSPPLKRSCASPPVSACLSDNKCENLQQHNTRNAEINVCVVAASSCPSCIDETTFELPCPTTVINEGKCSAEAGLRSSGRRDRRRSSLLGDSGPKTVIGPGAAFGKKWTAGPVLSRLPVSRFLLPTRVRDVSKWRPSGPGAVCLFSGSKRWAKALLRQGCPWVLTYEILEGQDLLDPLIQKEVFSLIEEGSVLCAGAGPVCSSFSTAVTPPVRNAEFPAGLPNLRPSMWEKVKQGNLMSALCVKIVKLCISHGVRFWIENPRTSWIWRLRSWRKLFSALPKVFGHVGPWDICYCRFGTPWQKRTRIFCDLDVERDELKCVCQCNHLALRGGGPKGVSWTKVAEPYPWGFSELLALLCADRAGWKSLPEDFSVAEFARKSCLSHSAEYDVFRPKRAKYDPRLPEGSRNILKFLAIIFPALRLVILINASIVACTRGRQWERALAVASEAFAVGRFGDARRSEAASTATPKVRPDVFSYNCLIGACTEGHRWQQAVAFVQEMRQSWGLRPKQVTYNMLLKSFEFGEQWELALATLEEMPRRSVPADAISFTSAMGACERRHRWEAALGLLQALGKNEVSADVILLSAAITAGGRSQQWPLVLHLLQNVRSQQLMPDVGVHNAAIAAFGRCHAWSLCLLQLAEMKRTFFMPTRSSYSSTSKACSAAGHWPMALALLKEAEGLGLGTDPVSRKATIEAQERSQKAEKCAERSAENNNNNNNDNSNKKKNNNNNMEPSADQQAESPPRWRKGTDALAFHAAISACCSGHRWAHALAVLGEMRQAALEPDAGTLGKLLEAMVDEGKLPQAVAIYREANQRSSSACATIAAQGVDLHNLPAELARLAVRVALLNAATAAGASPDKWAEDAAFRRKLGLARDGSLLLVVGLGRNSKSGEASLRPAVLHLLHEELGLHGYAEERNEGRLRVPATEIRRFLGARA
ncbi:unnamed protein product, partial [Polarella glacialis]